MSVPVQTIVGIVCRNCYTRQKLTSRLFSSARLLDLSQNNSKNHIHTSCKTLGTLDNFSKLLSSNQKSMNKVVSDAEKIVGYPTSFLSLRCLLSDELSNIAMQMRKLVGTKHPLLQTARGMVLNGRNNMQMRGLLVMLISKAAGPNEGKMSLSEESSSGVYNSQRSLAEITEVIHTANLIHKGVVNLDKLLPDDGPMNDMAFGNKMAVLSGDYLLASACSGLAALENPLVVEIVASAIGDIMTAEFTQYTDACGQPLVPKTCEGFSDWLHQTFLSFGSLLSKSCEAALILAGHPEHLQKLAFEFGKNLMYSYQLSKDMLPFVEKDETPNLSLTSAPIMLYRERATPEDFSHIQQLWDGGADNYEKIVSTINREGILQVCQSKCQEYRDKAISSLDSFPESDAKSALIRMAKVMSEKLL